jgi:hypothetical protein
LTRTDRTVAHQKLTHEWWENRRFEFELYTSEWVIQEARRGDPQAAEKRLQVLHDLPLLESTAEALTLAEIFLYQQRLLPETAREDALHIAISIVGDMDYLLTWNCRHIANAEIQRAITNSCHQMGYNMPILCTPEVLMGE